MKYRLVNLSLYKFDVPSETDVGVILVSYRGGITGERFQLTRHTGGEAGQRKRRWYWRRDAHTLETSTRAGLSPSLVHKIDQMYSRPLNSNIVNQIFDHIVSNFCFKDLDVVPPGCPVLVFHFHTAFGEEHVPEISVTAFVRSVLGILKTRDSELDVEDGTKRRVLIPPPVSEIVDCYPSLELEACSLCGEGYPKENEIVHKTKCNHFFHGTCISSSLSHTPQCPVCSTPLPPVDIRTLLFF